MDLENCKLYDENDVEVLENGISIDNIFFNKKEIADTFNELVFVRKFIETQLNKKATS